MSRAAKQGGAAGDLVIACPGAIMDPNQERQLNQDAYRQLSGFIKENHPQGRFVAIAGGKIVADAADFEELNSVLDRMGYHSAEVLVVQAGVDYPETAVIFAQGLQ